jgi:tetratricopeptide (TPR) repeat protein
MKIIVANLLLCITLVASGQNNIIKKADQHFSNFNYPKAVKKYEKAHKKGISPYYTSSQTAHCYRQMGLPTKSEMWYKKAIEYAETDNDTYFHLAQVLNQQQKNEEANNYLNRFFQNRGNKTLNLTSSHQSLIRYLRRDTTRYTISPMRFNTSYSEMGPSLYGDWLYYTTNQPQRRASQIRDVRNNKSFYRLMKYHTAFQRSEPITEKAFQSKLNIGPIAFANDGNMAFITRNILSKNNKTDLHIVISTNMNGKWDENGVRLPFKINNHSILHAAITPDGRRLYFASDNPGGFGGIDLYYSELRSGFWSNPINLGSSINTPGNEVFPFVANNGLIYFASDGHPGLGGLDIFQTITTTDGFAPPLNLGIGINSHRDDFAMVLRPDNKTGYFTSNRTGGKGDDDIYELTINRLAQLSVINGQTVMHNQTPVDAVQINILDADGHIFNQAETDSEGRFTLYIPNNSTFTLQFRKRLIQNKEIILQPSQLKPILDIVVELIER